MRRRNAVLLFVLMCLSFFIYIGGLAIESILNKTIPRGWFAWTEQGVRFAITQKHMDAKKIWKRKDGFWGVVMSDGQVILYAKKDVISRHK